MAPVEEGLDGRRQPPGEDHQVDHQERQEHVGDEEAGEEDLSWLAQDEPGAEEGEEGDRQGEEEDEAGLPVVRLAEPGVDRREDGGHETPGVLAAETTGPVGTAAGGRLGASSLHAPPNG